MTTIDDLIHRLRQSPRCRVLPPAGQPTLPERFALPVDGTRFYELCGGVEFFERDPDSDSVPDYRMLPPAEVLDIETATVGESEEGPPIDGWFAVGADDNGEHVVIDLNDGDARGPCYDVFHETYFRPDHAHVVALSFTELLERLFARGRAYWFDEGFQKYGYYATGD